MKLHTILFFSLLFFTSHLFAQSGWQLQNPKFTDDIFNGVCIDANTAVLGGYNLGLVKTTDGGISWEKKINGISLNSSFSTVQILKFINNNTGYILTDKIYKTVNGGNSWYAVSDKQFWKAAIGADGVIYGITNETQFNLVKSTNDGFSWITLKENISATFAYLNFSNALTGFYTNSPSINQKTTDGGMTWIDMTIPQLQENRNLVSISFADENTGFAMMYYGIASLKTTNGGMSWFTFTLPYSATEIQALPGNIVIAYSGGSETQKFMKSYNGGTDWIQKSVPASLYFKFYDASHGFGFYNDGAIYKSTNLGDSFENIGSYYGLTSDLIHIQALTNQKAYTLSSDSKFYSTINSGQVWSQINTNVNLVDFKFYNDVNAVGSTAGNIVTSSDGGVNWQIKSSAINAKSFQITSNGKFYFLSKDGNTSYIYYSNDNGATKNIVKSAVDELSMNYNSRYFFEDLRFINETTGYVILNNFYSGSLSSGEVFQILKTTNSGAEWTAVHGYGSSHANALYAFDNFVFFSNSQGIFKSSDFGATWNLINSELNNASSIEFSNSSTGFVAWQGKIYKTVNGGINWTLQNNSETVRQIDMFNSEIGYAIGSGGTIYFTDNGGNTEIQHNAALVRSYSLSQNYPNPFNPSTKINFSIPKSGLVQIKVFDMLGREVQTLLNEFKTAGEYKIDFDGKNLSSGIYFYKMLTNDYVETKKMILIK
jgi:photosystem II stability/assembly factor-like uncharacterized protein